MTQQLTWEKPGQDDERFRRYLVLALIRSGVCVTLQDTKLDYLFIANLLDCWKVHPEAPPSDMGIFGDELGQKLAVLKTEVRSTGSKGRMNASVGGDRHFEFIVEAIPSWDDDVDLMTTIIDLSEERQREKVLRSLLREVSHRSKNLLAIVQSIASQTAKHSLSLEQFLHRFLGRLHSLSHSQDLITDSSWQGATFSDLMRQQTARYLPGGVQPIAVTGDNVLLSPNAALHVGLALHELVVNAVTHGTLSRNRTDIAVSCRHFEEDGKKGVEVIWDEKLEGENAPDSSAPPVRRFGSTVLDRVVPLSVNGKAQYEIAPTRIFYRLTFPLESLE